MKVVAMNETVELIPAPTGTQMAGHDVLPLSFEELEMIGGGQDIVSTS